uniref:Tyrosine-protein kinase catalytic domain-containing protein n=1 Tax=Timema shepardi TaxID=629360 RepID=A0A7R9AQN7_TIMSH|nr:unnamed protein product [Timema shepardi]
MASLVLADSFKKLPDQITYPYAEPDDLQKRRKYCSPSSNQTSSCSSSPVLRRRDPEGKDPQVIENPVRPPDVELATLRELPRRGNFVHNSNALYTTAEIPTDEEIASLPHIRRGQIKLTKFLGSGAFGEVFEGNAHSLVDSSGSETKVAIKLAAELIVAVELLKLAAELIVTVELLKLAAEFIVTVELLKLAAELIVTVELLASLQLTELIVTVELLKLAADLIVNVELLKLAAELIVTGVLYFPCSQVCDISLEVRHQLMLKCWSYNPESRPTFKYCLDVLLELKDHVSLSDVQNVSRTASGGIENRGFFEDENHNNSSGSSWKTGSDAGSRDQIPILPSNAPGDIPRYLELLYDDSDNTTVSDGYEIPRPPPPSAAVSKTTSATNTLDRHRTLSTSSTVSDSSISYQQALLANPETPVSTNIKRTLSLEPRRNGDTDVSTLQHLLSAQLCTYSNAAEQPLLDAAKVTSLSCSNSFNVTDEHNTPEPCLDAAAAQPSCALPDIRDVLLTYE